MATVNTNYEFVMVDVGANRGMFSITTFYKWLKKCKSLNQTIHHKVMGKIPMQMLLFLLRTI